MNQIRVLIVEDERDQRDMRERLLRRMLAQAQHEIRLPEIKPGEPQFFAAACCADALDLLEQGEFEIALVDLALPLGPNQGVDNRAGFQILARLNPKESLVIAISAHTEAQFDVYRSGAHWCHKGPAEEELYTLVQEHLIKLNRQRGPDAQSMQRLDQLIIGKSRKMVEVKRKILHAADQDTQVLLLGETGTGKGEVARAIHSLSRRRAFRLEEVNLSGLQNGTFPSALFGHKKGAFTDAKEDFAGSFGEAKGGAVLLDEIGDATTEMQNALLQVLQERRYRPEGRPLVEVDFRIFIATERNLTQRVERGEMKQAFKARLELGDTIYLPPLRDRREDIDALVQHFLAKYNHLFGKDPAVTMESNCLDHLRGLEFKGNVRELEGLISQLVATCPGAAIRMNLLIPKLEEKPGASDPATPSDTSNPIECLKSYLISISVDWRQGFSKQALAHVLEEVSATYKQLNLPELMERHKGNESSAAADLGVNRGTLSEWLINLNLKTPRQYRKRD